jgi:hypothetical protein
MPEYNFINSVREELEQIRQEVADANTRATIDEVARRLGANYDETLAALWRASKRHGETLAVFLQDLQQQHERDVARQAEGAGVR